MLTSDLVFSSKRGRYIKPCFIDTKNPELLALSENLISCFRSAVKNRLAYKQLEDTLFQFRAANSKTTPVNALIKLLDDRIVRAAAVEETDYQGERNKLFSHSAALLKNGNIDGLLQFTLQNTFDPYGDLPEFDVITDFKDILPQELLERYNTALVQAILFKAEKLTVKVNSDDQGELRRLLKYLKFFRLLCDIKKDVSGKLKLEISGPLSLFGPTRKYALNLAAFFPAVLRFDEWEIRAEIKNRSSFSILKLDNESRLVSHYRNFSSYVPEEIKVFHRLFSAKSDDWKIIGDTPLFIAGKGCYIAPDLSFIDRENQHTLHLELFHRWHKLQLETRLEYLERNQDMPLIIGIDRAICDETKLDELTEKYPAAMGKSFRFRDFPGVDTVIKKLNSQKAKNNSDGNGN